MDPRDEPVEGSADQLCYSCGDTGEHDAEAHMTSLRMQVLSQPQQVDGPSASSLAAAFRGFIRFSTTLSKQLQLRTLAEWLKPKQNPDTLREQKQLERSCRVLAAGRTLFRVPDAPPVPVTEQIVQKTKSHPADPEPPAPVQAPVSARFLSEVAQHVPTTLRIMPRLSDFGSLAGNSDLST